MNRSLRRAAPSAALLALVTFAPSVAPAAPDDGEAQWLRYPAISPDGTRIAFSWRGDLWVVPAEGGEARPLTTHEACERSPVWSPDGATIAFASDRHGNFDVFAMPSRGGAATRLTWHSREDRPTGFSPDGQRVLFTSARLDDPRSAMPAAPLPELYEVPVTGGRAIQLLTTPAESARWSPDGKLLAYHDRKGYENEWRKHHRSSVTRDVWVWNPADGSHRRVSVCTGEDRDPAWAADGKSLWWLSEESGSYNVWRRDLAGDAACEPVTTLGPGPVRFLSASDTGVLCFAYDGGIWTLAPGGDPRRVTVRAVADDRTNPVRIETFRGGATEMALSPEEDEVAFVVRGEVFVASVEHGTTRRVTSTPEQERSVSWGADGRSLYYSGERGGSWNLYRASLARPEEEHFFNASAVTESVVLADQDETFQPAISPDGKLCAYLRNRDAIDVLDFATGASRNVVPSARNYSYADGDIQFEWSPDSRRIAFTYVARQRWVSDIGMVDVTDGAIVQATDTGYEEFTPHWGPDGRALFFASNRLGRKSHGGWGADGDIFALDLTREAHDRAKLPKDEFALLREKEEEKEDAAKPDGEKDGERKDGADDKRKRGKKPERKPPPVVRLEPQDLDRRVRRVTLFSAPLGGYAVAPDGEALVYAARVETKWELWLAKPREHETRKLVELGPEEPGEVVFGREGKAVFVRKGGGGIAKVELGGLLEKGGEGSAKVKDVAYVAEMSIDEPAERAYVFEHAWRQVRGKFYDPKLHGVDWPALKAQYARFLPDIATQHDFAELLSELLGELNASHTGARYRPDEQGGAATASLGLLFDPRWTGEGLRVVEVLSGGPADRASSRIVAGVTVLAIDGVAQTPAVDPAQALDHKAARPVLLRLRAADGATEWDEVLRPIDLGEEGNLLYERWVRRCRETVERVSGGRVGYVHVRGMEDGSYRRVFSDTLGRASDLDALIVDTRFNGGGWLHDDLVAFLGGKRYLDFVPRGKAPGDFGSDPWGRWTKPVAVLQSEGNYSDAHIFPFAFQRLGLGKLVGTPVAGTGTAVWWERQIDPRLVFGIPQVGMRTPEGVYLENTELQPDVLVLNEPKAVAEGRDDQLLRAVEVLTK